MDDPLISRLRRSRDQPSESKIDSSITDDQIQLIRQYFTELISRNGSRAVKVNSVKVIGGSHTRDGFLNKVVEPLFVPGKNLRSLLSTVDEIQHDLQSFGIFDKVHMLLDDSPSFFKLAPISSKLDIDAVLHLQEMKRFTAKTGTDLGNGEGNGYVNGTWKNVFGGAEILSLDATIGTRTRSSYMANYVSPVNILSHWYRLENHAFITSRHIPWASHEQFIRGISSKLKSSTQEIGVEWVWRSIQCNNSTSEAIRLLAGNSMKSSIYHTWIPIDSRDDPFMPSSGYFLKVLQEFGSAANVPFYKTLVDAQTAYSPLSGTTVTASIRAGILLSKHSHLMDRFYLGGPNDVRGFYLNSMGPRSEGDSLGGQGLYAFGLGILTPIPRVALSTPLRFQTFINGGMLSSNPSLMHLPSVTAGVGLVYRHSMARFELNFSLPLMIRKSEVPRKGLQFGVGLSFL